MSQRIQPSHWWATVLRFVGLLLFVVGLACLAVWNGALVSLAYGRGPWLLGPLGFGCLALAVLCIGGAFVSGHLAAPRAPGDLAG